MTNPVRLASVTVCPGCARMRALVERLVASGVNWLDACDLPSADLEDDDDEVISEDEGVVDAATLDRGLRG